MKISLHPQVLLVSPAFAFLAQKLAVYTEHLNKVVTSEAYTEAECSLNLPSDEMIFLDAQHIIKKLVSPKLKYIIDIGIGGSNLGTKAVYDSLSGYRDMWGDDVYPKIFFADTNDSEYTQALVKFLLAHVQDPEEVLFIVVSKSGATLETLVNFEIVYQALLTRFNTLATRVVVITDEKSPLWKEATKKQFMTQSLPKLVGGRYSVFSAVGIVPLLACGLDVTALLRGARSMRDTCLLHNLSLNPALLSACVQFHFSLEGKNIHNSFFFHPQMESLGKWYRQLIGESIGKEFDRDGNQVRVGITPIVSIGSTDLHSVGQLYLAGPRDKVTTFISTAKSDIDLVVPSEPIFENLLSNSASLSTGKVMKAILGGVMLAYEKEELPFIHVEFKTLDAESLGQFMQWKMVESMYLAELFNVNAFDQPNVESYKTETKRIVSI